MWTKHKHGSLLWKITLPRENPRNILAFVYHAFTNISVTFQLFRLVPSSLSTAESAEYGWLQISTNSQPGFCKGQMMKALTRNQATAQIRDILLDGHSLTPTQFDRYLSSAGGHERSRVLTLLRNDWGIPVEQRMDGAYHIPERDLVKYRLDKAGMLCIWRTNARYTKILRKVESALRILRGIRGDVSESSFSEITQAIGEKYL